jgi:SAM-dependent methyltransferase
VTAALPQVPPSEDALRRDLPLSDATFDRIYPSSLRVLSAVHWTPVAIARQVARLLVVRPAMHVLDVGSGVGKLCIVGALTTGARWTGLERRPDLRATAAMAARELGASAATEFRRADFLHADWSRYDGLYVYNPIGSLVDDLPGLDALGRAVAYRRWVAQLQIKLHTVRAGARLVTYHGIGGRMPGGFTLLASYPTGTDALDVWIRDG